MKRFKGQSIFVFHYSILSHNILWKPNLDELFNVIMKVIPIQSLGL